MQTHVTSKESDNDSEIMIEKFKEHLAVLQNIINFNFYLNYLINILVLLEKRYTFFGCFA